MVTAALEDGQTPLLIVQTNELLPTLKFDTPVLKPVGEFIEADPGLVQLPVPTEGEFAFRVIVVAQTV